MDEDQQDRLAEIKAAGRRIKESRAKREQSIADRQKEKEIAAARELLIKNGYGLSMPRPGNSLAVFLVRVELHQDLPKVLTNTFCVSNEYRGVTFHQATDLERRRVMVQDQLENLHVRVGSGELDHLIADDGHIR